MTHFGDVVTGFSCPKCEGFIIYNGNYFCQHLLDDTCTWAMDPDDPWQELIEAYKKQRGLE